ncbi:MAG: M1 family aminopeptidase [Bacteroidota bacterium]
MKFSSRQFGIVFRYELNSLLTNPMVYVYFFSLASIAFIGFLSNAGVFAEGSSINNNPELVNSPFAIGKTVQSLNKLIIFLVPAVIGYIAFSDFKEGTHSILYSFPVNKWELYLAKYTAGTIVALIIAILVHLILVLAEILVAPYVDIMSPLNVNGHLSSFVFFTAPNIVFMGMLVFTGVLLFRNRYIGFLMVVLFFLLQNTSQAIFGGHDFLVALFDPFAENSLLLETKLWSRTERDILPIPFNDHIIHNRLFWTFLGVSVFVLGLYKVKLFQFSSIGKIRYLRFQRSYSASNLATERDVGSFKAHTDFSAFSTLKTSLYLTKMYISSLLKSWIFYIMMLSGLATVYFLIKKVTYADDIAILPVTGVVFTIPAFFFGLIVMLLTFLYAGILINKETNAKMDALADATPVKDEMVLLAKFLTLVSMQFILLTVMLVACVTVQWQQGFYDTNWGDLLIGIYVVQFTGLFIWAGVSLFVHSVSPNFYLGIFILVLGWLGVSGLEQFGVEEKLILFNFSEPMQFSELSKYGGALRGFLWLKAYWVLFSISALALALVFWRRGYNESYRDRIKSRRGMFSKPVKLLITILLIGLCPTGFTIKSIEYESAGVTEKEQERRFTAFEEYFSKYALLKRQPDIASVNLKVNLVPETGALHIRGTYILQNRSGHPVDTLLIKMGFNETTAFQIQRDYRVLDHDAYVKFKVVQLESPLKPNEKLVFKFEMDGAKRTIFNNTSKVLRNGTFIKNDILPRFGYFLGPGEEMPDNSQVGEQSYYGSGNLPIDFEAVISTSNDQTVTAPGSLMRAWNRDGRNYFHFKSKVPIRNSYGFSSCRYQSDVQHRDSIRVDILYHKKHDYNVGALGKGVLASKRFNTKYFSPYPFEDIRVSEFPMSMGTYATAFSNQIPTSEIRYVANSTNGQLDFAFYTMAHEVTHYWWGDQVSPAKALGALMLTESITEYITLRIFEEEFGSEEALRFLKLQRERYLTGRTRESEVEPPLILVKQRQQYLAYAKGTMALNSIAHQLGQEKFMDVLKHFYQRYTMEHERYPTSLDFVGLLKEHTPDSLQYVIKDQFETVTFYDSQIKSVRPKGNGTLQLVLDVSKYREEIPARKVPLREWIEIGFYKDETLLGIKKYLVHERRSKIDLSPPKGTTKIVLDPKLLTIDKNLEDNEYLLKDNWPF